MEHSNYIWGVTDEETVHEKKSSEIKPNDFYNNVTVTTSTIESQPPSTETATDQYPTERLYPVEETRGAELNNSIQLISEALELTNEALETIQEDNIFGSEDAMQRVHLILPELFCCRELGDGFGMIVMGLFHAYKDLNGKPLNKEQICQYQYLLKTLLNEPFLSAEEAINKLVYLEELGLSINPKRLKPEQES